MEKALTCMLKAVEVTPSENAAWNNLGLIYYRTRNYAAARPAFEKAVQVEPEASMSLLNMVVICHALGDLDEARKYCDKLAKIDPLEAAAARKMYLGGK